MFCVKGLTLTSPFAGWLCWRRCGVHIIQAPHGKCFEE